MKAGNFDAPLTRQVLRLAGLLFGMLYGLSFALLIWGRDGWLLARSAAAWPWLHLAAGLPLTLLVGGVTGWLAALLPSMGWTVLLWIVVNGAFGLLAGHIPYEGASLLAGLLEPRVAGLELYAFTLSHEVRTWLIALGLAVVGVAVGMAQAQMMETVWDRVASRAQMAARRWQVVRALLAQAWMLLPVGLLLALLPALIVNELLSNPRLIPVRRTDLLVQTMLTGGEAQVQADALNINAARRYGARFTPTYTQHFVEFTRDTETLYASTVDVAFDNGFIMRCNVMGNSVSSCVDVSELYPVWMAALITGALEGTQPWRQLGQPLEVAAPALAELAASREMLTGDFSVRRVLQRGGLLWLEARYEDGGVLTCRFRGAMPVTVEACVADEP